MGIDYLKTQILAERLIRENGRVFTFIRPSEVAADPNKPWRGPSEIAPPQTLEAYGVFVPPNQVRIFGLSALGDASTFEDLIKFSEQIIITYTGETHPSIFTQVQDEGSLWGITGVQTLKPGSTRILSYVGVRR